MTTSNPYLPELVKVTKIIEETPNIKSFQVIFKDPEQLKNFKFEPGQVGQLSVFGVGESTFVINSPPTRMDYLQFSVMRTGEVTNVLHEIFEGDEIGLRAPLGNYFPYNDMKGKKILFIGGGIGLAPLRTLILYMLDNRSDYDDVTILYGARTPSDLCYKTDLEEWESRSDVNLVLTVDNEFPGWTKRVGMVPNVLKEMAPSPENTVAITCGPPIMIKFTLQALAQLNFKEENIVTTLEKRMKCGIGICGRCNIGHKYVCKDGPVFTLKELNELPPDE